MQTYKESVNPGKQMTVLTFLDALASLGSMLESQSVTQSFMFLRFCQILGISSGYVQGIVRCVQSVFKVCSECVQSVFRVCS